MTKQTVYLVLNIYDGEDPTPVQIYDNRESAEQHAALLNSSLGGEKDDPAFIFTVWEWSVLSEFNL